MKGYPPWPGKIIGAKKHRFYVYFFGTENYGWVQVKDLYPYEEFVEVFSFGIKLPALKRAVADIIKCYDEERTSSDEIDDDIPLSQVVSSVSDEDVPLSSFVQNETDNFQSNSKVQQSDEMRYVLDRGTGTCKLARVKHTKRVSYENEDHRYIISVSINDEVAIKSLIPKELIVCLDRCDK
nr:putative oxidoreductase GLYR1 [Parasteatoda tepidariorum]